MMSSQNNRLETKIDQLSMKINYLTELIEYQNNRRQPTRSPTSSSSLFNNLFSSTRIPTTTVPSTAPNMVDDTFELSFTTPTSNSASIINTLLGIPPQVNQSSQQRGITITELLGNTSLVVYHENDETETCSICTEEYQNHDIQRKINRCNHLFHSRCLENWVTNHSTCPLCREEIVNN
jgi:hypothetical protein